MPRLTMECLLARLAEKRVLWPQAQAVDPDAEALAWGRLLRAAKIVDEELTNAWDQWALERGTWPPRPADIVAYVQRDRARKRREESLRNASRLEGTELFADPASQVEAQERVRHLAERLRRTEDES